MSNTRATTGPSRHHAGSIPTMADIRTAIEQYMIMGPEYSQVVDLIIAVALSLETERPLWLMIVAPPSSGKTELLRAVSKVPDYHPIPSLTSRFLFSGHPTAQGGFMIREVGKKGLLAFPDFTTVLSMNSAARREVLNQLRVIHDGVAGRGTGIDTGETRIWKGRIAVIACTTNTIERFREHTNDLGERFLYYLFQPRVPRYGEISSMPSPSASQRRVQSMVKTLVRAKKLVIHQTEIPPADGELLLCMAQFIGRARAQVTRDGYTREISHVHPAEMPFRVLKGLETLYRCLLAINAGDATRANTVVKSVALSSVPTSRVAVLRAVGSSPVGVKRISEVIGLPEITVRRTVEEMEVQSLIQAEPVERTPGQNYTIHPGFRGLCASVGLGSASGARTTASSQLI